MNALTKFLLALLTATAIAVYLYAAPGDEGFDAARSNPQDAICKQDGERLARLRARPSLDEGLRFVGEIRCMQLWPQLQTLLDGLSDPSGSTASSKLNPAASDTPFGSDAASPPRSTSSTLDDACKHDEDRLAKLRANPSADAAIRFDSELKCPKLKPQLLALVDSLSQRLKSAAAQSRNGAPSDTTSASEAVPPISEPPASDATADACKHDEERLAELQAKPSLDEAIRFENEMECLELQPQVLALLDKLIQAPQSAGAQSRNGAPSDTTTSEAVPPTSEPPASQVSESAIVSEGGGAQMNATSGTLPAPQAAADPERRIVQLRSEKEALPGEVSRIRHDQEAPSSADETKSTPSPQPPSPIERSEAQPPSQAGADAERRVAQLESENEALTAEVSRLQHDREAAFADETKSPPAPPPAAHAKPGASDPFSALASLPTGMPPRVLIRYLPNNADARAQAETLASVLKRQGIEVADLRESRGAIRPELSFSYAPDEPIALQVGHLVGIEPMRRLQPKDGLMVRPGTVELNLSGDSHLAAIKTTSTRESNHE
jgi:hypothetical protein